ncbi:DUF1810 domain-containing protein [Sphingomonas crusticola]|uniref:DUF1810 domain-containing protein n=1 Tax=Sphingomonas crusticola TaxID=1697973 RepID=UPI000E283CF7|nr:DUF1810 domain-containing protein [Sphingomonas crusticola]
MADPFHLDRFVRAQAEIYDTALDELRAGRKTSHWIWFIFPQIAGLGRSPTARHYAIGSLEEAQAYLHHPLLGTRLAECLAALQALGRTSADAVFGSLDAMKFRSSLTLFHAADPGNITIRDALDSWFDGQEDEATLELLRGA